MPPNRTTQNRDEKRAEILDAATRLFIDDGYEATSLAKLARAAGVTPNTIYWYFDDKDAVLVAVLERILREAGAEYLAERPETLTERLLWLVGVFERLDALTVAVHVRARASESVRQWHEHFHATGDAWLLAEARRHLARRPSASSPSEEALASVPRIWSYAIEGMVAHELSSADRRALCESLVRQLDGL